jgi:hypothetical protein
MDRAATTTDEQAHRQRGGAAELRSQPQLRTGGGAIGLGN